MEIKKSGNHNSIETPPYGWNTKTLSEVANYRRGSFPQPYGLDKWYDDINGLPFVQVFDVDDNNRLKDETKRYISLDAQKMSVFVKKGSIVLTIQGSIGRIALTQYDAYVDRTLLIFESFKTNFDPYFFMLSVWQIFEIEKKSAPGGIIKTITKDALSSFKISFPNIQEQRAIANALSDADAYIASLEKLIEKKRQIKQGAMQELLKPKDGWETKRIGDVALILDNLRKPLNDNERIKMKGDIPYCGANNIVDYVNDYVIDDDIILIAEDGGNFDQYKTRPIAYRMAGKSWVNNHAHIVKSKPELDQNFLFYSVVHKNILDYINGGTRAKLNKGELVNIEINIPPNKKQQAEISRILDDIESDISKQMQTLDKAKSIKEGMMQQLLTGKIRLTS